MYVVAQTNVRAKLGPSSNRTKRGEHSENRHPGSVPLIIFCRRYGFDGEAGAVGGRFAATYVHCFDERINRYRNGLPSTTIIVRAENRLNPTGENIRNYEGERARVLRCADDGREGTTPDVFKARRTIVFEIIIALMEYTYKQWRGQQCNARRFYI